MPSFLIAAREFVYAGRKIGAGQTFSACDPDVDILTKVGLASSMPIDDEPEPDPDPDPEPEPEPLEPVKRKRGRPRKLPS